MPENETYFQELIGNICEIKTEQNDLLVVARVKSIDSNDTGRINLVSAQDDERLPLLAYNTPVKIVSFASQQGFLLLRGNVYISTDEILTLVNVNSTQGYERRKYFRLNTNTTASAVVQHKYSNTSTEEEVLTLVLYDISLGGIRIGTSKALKPGDLLLTTFELMDKKMEFCCRVCREISAKRALPNEKQYGCEFVGFSTRQIDQLCNILFKLQRIEIKRRKKNRYD